MEGYFNPPQDAIGVTKELGKLYATPGGDYKKMKKLRSDLTEIGIKIADNVFKI